MRHIHTLVKLALLFLVVVICVSAGWMQWFMPSLCLWRSEKWPDDSVKFNPKMCLQSLTKCPATIFLPFFPNLQVSIVKWQIFLPFQHYDKHFTISSFFCFSLDKISFYWEIIIAWGMILSHAFCHLEKSYGAEWNSEFIFKKINSIALLYEKGQVSSKK